MFMVGVRGGLLLRQAPRHRPVPDAPVPAHRLALAHPRLSWHLSDLQRQTIHRMVADERADGRSASATRSSTCSGAAPFRTQAFAAVCILVGTWLMYTLYPYSGVDLTAGAEEVGVKKEWRRNIWPASTPSRARGRASATPSLPPGTERERRPCDRPLAAEPAGRSTTPLSPGGRERREPPKGTFKFNSGGYQTINFIPSLATMLFGLMCGELLRRSAPRARNSNGCSRQESPA